MNVKLRYFSKSPYFDSIFRARRLVLVIVIFQRLRDRTAGSPLCKMDSDPRRGHTGLGGKSFEMAERPAISSIARANFARRRVGVFDLSVSRKTRTRAARRALVSAPTISLSSIAPTV